MELKIEHLSYTYNPGTPFEKKALDDISLTIGKLLMPTQGSVFVDGEDIAGEGYPLRQLRFRVGVVFQYPEYQLFESDVLKDVSFGPKNQGLSDEEVLARAREAMRSVGLDESYETRSPFELSGGQKRRAAIAGILAMNPQMLVLDEPTAGMDPKGREEVLDLLRQINRERNITIVLVSHSMELKIEHLSYTYNPGTPFEKKALDDISLTIGKSAGTTALPLFLPGLRSWSRQACARRRFPIF